MKNESTTRYTALFILKSRPHLLCTGLTAALLMVTAVLFVPVFSWGETIKTIEWDEPVEVAEEEAYRGPWRMNDSDWRFVDDPTVYLTDQGHAGVAWVDQAGQDVFFQVFAPDGQKRFDEPVNVSRSPGIFSWLPRVIMTSQEPEAVYILWQEIIFSGGTHGGEIFFAGSDDGGRTFSEPINLSNTIAGAGKGRLTGDIWFNGSLDLALCPEGILYAAWTEYEGSLRFSRSTDQGKSFSEPVFIAGSQNELPARGPNLAVDPEGGVHLVWTVGEDAAADIHYARSTDQGNSFSDPEIITPSEGYSDAPRIAVDGQGTFHLIYTEAPFGPLQRLHVRHSRSEENDLFSDSSEISGGHTQIFPSVGYAYLDLDSRDNIYVLWELFPEEGFIHPQGLGITFSEDQGQTFASPEIVPGTRDPELGFNGSQQGLYMNKLAVNKNGELAIVNSTFRENEASRIRLIRGRISGEP